MILRVDTEGKSIEWLGSSLDDLRNCPEDARREAGFDLHRVQHGLMPRNWKPMHSIGAGAMEIRVRTGRAHRVLYVSKFGEAVYVLHVFEKKSRKTSALDLAVGEARYRELIRLRKSR